MKLFFALPFIALAAPAAAQQWQLPENCTGYLTIQQRGCVVSNHYTCEGDPEGHQWRVDFMEIGPVFASQIDRDTQWLQSLSLFNGSLSTLEDTPPDPASLDELLETGIDTYDFTTIDSDGSETRWRGADVLTGETVEIDGVELQVMTYTSESDTPDGRFRNEGVNYVSSEWRLFLPGISNSFTSEGDPLPESDNTPVDFIFPNETGFFSQSPIYDCGVQDVSAPLME
jgi:hypothetical protein